MTHSGPLVEGPLVEGRTAIASRLDAFPMTLRRLRLLDAFPMTLRRAHSHRLRLDAFQMTLRRLQVEVEEGGWSHEAGCPALLGAPV